MDQLFFTIDGQDWQIAARRAKIAGEKNMTAAGVTGNQRNFEKLIETNSPRIAEDNHPATKRLR